MSLNKEQVYLRAIDHYGVATQLVVAIEEMAELVKEITKAFRGKANKSNIIEEMADVEIMLDQLKLIVEISDQDVDEIKMLKILRLNNRINEEND